MAKTIRIKDEDWANIKGRQSAEESDADTLHRLLKNINSPPASQNITGTRPEWVDELKRDLAREIKTAIESAMAR